MSIILGKDSIRNDGIYTGFLPAHKINAAEGAFFSLKVSCLTICIQIWLFDINTLNYRAI